MHYILHTSFIRALERIKKYTGARTILLLITVFITEINAKILGEEE